jgi:protein tyrosine phosphatase (PTP) superfamily phosphohydrolase (DUF442 family)
VMGNMINILNFVLVSDQYGTSGQPLEKEFSFIAQAGYKHVINLATLDHPDALLNEDAIVSSLNMSYLHIPVPFQTPRTYEVKLFCALLQALGGEKVYIHCILNYRVSAFMFHYLNKIKGFSTDEARSSVFQNWDPDPVWKDVFSWDAEKIGV